MTSRFSWLAALAAGSIVLSSCSNPQAEDSAATAASSSTPAAASSSTPAAASSNTAAASDAAEPEMPAYSQIVAVTAETSALALALAGPEHLSAISATAQVPGMGMNPELARQVDTTLPSGVHPDAEQILALNPDLVLLAARHGSEQSVAEQLEATGVPTLTFSSADFDTPEAYAATIRRLGAELGLNARAEELASEFEAEIAELDKQRPPATATAPRTLALMARGGQVMAMDADNTLPALAVRAGGQDAATEVGISHTGPIDAELLVRANPDIIFLEDFMGAGRGPFEALLANPALAEVPAIAQNRIVLVPMDQASTLAGLNMPAGYELILQEVGR